MSTLSVLHKQNLIGTAEEVLLPQIREIPEWELTVTSLRDGASLPMYRSFERNLRVLPAYWPELDIRQLLNFWPGHRVSSVELTDEEYDEIIAVIEGRSTRQTSPVV